MSDGDVQLRGGERSCDRGVGVTIDEDYVGFLGQYYLFELLDHPSRHRAMTEAANLKIIGWSRNLEFLEEHVGHRGIEMLAGMHENLADSPGRKRAANRRGLDKLGPSPDNG